MRNHFISCISLLYFTVCMGLQMFAQNVNSVIKGNVSDKTTGEALIYTAVGIFDETGTKVIGSGTTDLDGVFQISTPHKGKAVLTIKYMGYAPFTKDIEIGSSTTLEVGDIALQPTETMLEGVTIVGKKESVNVKEGTMTFNMDEYGAGAGSLSDIMNTLPSVTVDEEGKPSVRGEGLTILVNGEVPELENPLEEIPLSLIDNIELITNPPAEYNAEGAVINIILKKNAKLGNLIRVNGEYGLPEQYRFSASVTNTQDKFSWSANAQLNQINYPSEQRTERLTYQWNTFNEQNQDNYYTRPEQRAKLSGTYHLNLYNKISASYSFNRKNVIYEAHSHDINLDSDTDEIKNTSERISSTDQIDIRHNIEARYEKKFLENDKRRFNVMFRYKVNQNERDNSSDAQIYNPDGSLKYERRNLNNNISPSTNLYGSIRYSHPINEITSLSTGVSADHNNIETDIDIEQLRKDDPATDWELYREDTQYSSIKRSNVSPYMQWKSKIGRLKYTVGVRANYNQIEATTPIGDEMNDFSTSTFQWNPSFRLSYPLKEGLSMSASFSTKYRNPSIRHMNPAINNLNPLFISFGNPNLKPQRSDNFEVEVIKHSKKMTWKATAYLLTVNNMTIQQIEVKQGSYQDTTITSYTNVEGKKNIGLELYNNISITRKTRFTTTLLAYNTNMNIREEGLEEKNKIVYSARGTLQFPMLKEYFVKVSGYYKSNDIYFNGERSAYNGMDFSVSRKFLKNKNGRVFLYIQDVLGTREKYSYNKTQRFERESWYSPMTVIKLGASISLSYK